MERSSRDFKKPKLAESGKPDLKTPVSTIAKFSGGTSNSSPSRSPSSTAIGRDLVAVEFPKVNDCEASVAVHITGPKLSTFMDLAPKIWNKAILRIWEAFGIFFLSHFFFFSVGKTKEEKRERIWCWWIVVRMMNGIVIRLVFVLALCDRDVGREKKAKTKKELMRETLSWKIWWWISTLLVDFF